MRKVASFLAVLISLILAGSSARAEDATAEALYQEGRRAAAAKDWATACKKFRESHDREPAPGTLLNLADCEENQGKLLGALTHFEAAARLFPAGHERSGYAKERAASVGRRVPKLTVRLHPASPTGTRVELDGKAIDAHVAIPLDPGAHALLVAAPGRADVRSSIRLSEGESREIEVAAGVVASSTRPAETPEPAPTQAPPTMPPATSTPAPATSPQAPAPGAPPGPAAGTENRAASLRTAGWIGVGAGAASMGVGVIGAIITASAKSSADRNCTPACNADGLDAQSRGKTWSAIGTAGFVVGSVGLLAGAGILLFVAPSRSAASRVGIQPVAGGAALGWAGTF